MLKTGAEILFLRTSLAVILILLMLHATPVRLERRFAGVDLVEG